MNVFVHFAEADQARIDPHLHAMRALGLQVTSEVVSAEGQYSRQAGALDIYYFSFSLLKPPLQSAFVSRLRDLPVNRSLVVFLDAVELVPELDAKLRGLPSLMGYSAPQDQLLRKLTRCVLEQIDQLNETTVMVNADESDQTQMLPRSLVVHAQEQEFVIPQDYLGLVTIGRGTSCQIQLQSSFVSRLHGCLRSSAQQFYYRDLSSNGTTLLHGHEESLLRDVEVPLPAQCSLRVGDVVMALVVHD